MLNSLKVCIFVHLIIIIIICICAVENRIHAIDKSLSRGMVTDDHKYKKKMKIEVDLSDVSHEQVLRSLSKSYPKQIKLNGILDNSQSGGTKVAIIIPYRERYYQLAIFLRHMHPFFISQNLDYRFFLINQTDNLPFNKATLLNVGFLESQKFNNNYNCFIYNDIDMLPESEFNQYECSNSPEHFAVHVDVFNYRMPYSTYFGGVVGISKDHYLKVNGCSNMFWGWGGEDDDFDMRCVRNNLKIHRKPNPISRYTTIRKNHNRVNSSPNPKRHHLLDNFENYRLKSGLNDVTYKVIGIEVRPLYTVVNVDLSTMYERYRNI